MTLPGGLRFDEVRRGADASRSFGILSWGSSIRFNAIRIGRTFHVTDNIPLQGKETLRQISRRTGVRIVDSREIALSGQSSIPSTDTDSLLNGEELNQTKLLQDLMLLDQKAPPPDIWDKMESVNELYTSVSASVGFAIIFASGGLLTPLGAAIGSFNPIDLALKFRSFVDNPSFSNVVEILKSVTIRPFQGLIQTFGRLF